MEAEDHVEGTGAAWIAPKNSGSVPGCNRASGTSPIKMEEHDADVTPGRDRTPRHCGRSRSSRVLIGVLWLFSLRWKLPPDFAPRGQQGLLDWLQLGVRIPPSTSMPALCRR